MLSFYRIPPITHKRKQKISNTNLDDNSNNEHELKSPKMTSNYLKGSQLTSKESFLSIETVIER